MSVQALLTDSVTTSRVDYLQRCGDSRQIPCAPYTVGEPEARRLLHVRGIGRPLRDPGTHTENRGERWRPPTAELITGLYGYRIPLAYIVEGSQTGVKVAIGTWPTSSGGDPAHDDMQIGVIGSVLNGLYPVVDSAFSTTDSGVWASGGVALGIPAPSGLDRSDGSSPIDRVIRSMSGTAWQVAILAQPVSERAIAGQREALLNEMRVVMSAAQNEAAPSPLTEHYVELLKLALASTADGMATGAWRTAVYLLGDRDSYPRLASAWRSVMSGPKSLPEPVRTIDMPRAAELAQIWALPNNAGDRGAGHYQRPFEFQTFLSTAELASCVHLPELESPGFTVRPAPSFSVSRPAPSADGPSLAIGDVMVHRRSAGTTYGIELDQLTRHAFVAGLTGGGKTNTLMHLLEQASATGVPFLVIEPAKTEYRELLSRGELGRNLRIFTVAREHVAPLRLNPFEVAPGVDVSTHLDLLKAVFTASFAMWVPLPQVLERCLIDVYSERGWDFASGAHPQPDASGAAPVPTLTDLVAAVERTVPTLGYKGESTQEITASLTTRLNALRRGARGLMFDVQRSIPMSEILRAPTVIELEGLGDDGDKAFMMGLLLIRLYEHRRSVHAAALSAAARRGRPAPKPGVLSHIVVIEEAHRLLGAQSKPGDSYTADPKGAFVDTFTQMLSEVRAYGQGIVIADQVPVRLAPDVLKNTNLKIAHRLVAGDDRTAMAQAMSMSPEQAMQLALLPPGRAAVFSEGDHTPVMVQVPRAKDHSAAAAVDDAAVIAAARAWRGDPAIGRWYAESGACRGACPDPKACRAAVSLVESPDGRLLAVRMWQMTLEHPEGIDVVWPDVSAYVAARAAGSDGTGPALATDHSYLDALVHCFALHAIGSVTARRAIQNGWSGDAVVHLEELFRAVVAERVQKGEQWIGATVARIELLGQAARMQTRAFNPLPLCDKVCRDKRCPFMHALADVRSTARYSAMTDSGAPADDRLLDAATALAQEVTQMWPMPPGSPAAIEGARWRATACAAQLLRTGGDDPQFEAGRVEAVLAAAGFPFVTDNLVTNNKEK